MVGSLEGFRIQNRTAGLSGMELIAHSADHGRHRDGGVDGVHIKAACTVPTRGTEHVLPAAATVQIDKRQE
jgi:hypothetical protein